MINTKGQQPDKTSPAAQKDKLIENYLKTTNWNWTDWGCPEKIPIQESKLHPKSKYTNRVCPGCQVKT
jgi:hypothetical protein